MGSRARGRQANSLTNEQLQSMGCVGKDIPPVPTAPPPTFPPLMNKPVTVDTTAAQNYQILWKEDFLNHMRDYFLTPIPKMTADQRYSDQYNKLLENTREKCRSEIPWDIIPLELKSSGKRKLTKGSSSKIRKKTSRSDQIFNNLDSINDIEVEDEDNPENKKNASSDSEKDENEEIENEEDDEMDDENDYGNNYFDNGEAFNEEDDNLDDGPIY